MESVTVSARSKSYYVHIGSGLLDCAGALSQRPKGKAMVVSDSNVAPLYISRVQASLKSAGFEPYLHVFPAGESSKCASTLFEILADMAKCRLTRKDTVFALGGGVTGDLAGLAASLYMRGIGLVQLPTSLLSAVDSSVGGKTAIDLPEGKNLVGTFCQPDAVLCDIDVFSTLSSEQIANGFGEIVKTGVIRDARLFDASAASSIDMKKLISIVHRCIEIKRDVVRADEKESGLRQILNFGHTFGHAIEKCSNFSIPHGFCVAIGMVLIANACVKRGICSEKTRNRIAAALKARNLPVSTDLKEEELFSAMMSDKKRSSNSLTLILPLDIGVVERRKVSLEEARKFLADGLEG